MTKQLSPAAQSIYNAVHAADSAPFLSLADVIAAALRALAVRIIGADDIRQDILAIADELEAQ